MLRPIWERIPETASRVRQRIEAVLDAARVKGGGLGRTRRDGRVTLPANCHSRERSSRCVIGLRLPGRRWVPSWRHWPTREGIAALALRFVI